MADAITFARAIRHGRRRFTEAALPLLQYLWGGGVGGDHAHQLAAHPLLDPIVGMAALANTSLVGKFGSPLTIQWAIGSSIRYMFNWETTLLAPTTMASTLSYSWK